MADIHTVMGMRSVGDHASIEVWTFRVTGNMCSASQYGELFGEEDIVLYVFLSVCKSYFWRGNSVFCFQQYEVELPSVLLVDEAPSGPFSKHLAMLLFYFLVHCNSLNDYLSELFFVVKRKYFSPPASF